MGWPCKSSWKSCVQAGVLRLLPTVWDGLASLLRRAVQAGVLRFCSQLYGMALQVFLKSCASRCVAFAPNCMGWPCKSSWKSCASRCVAFAPQSGKQMALQVFLKELCKRVCCVCSQLYGMALQVFWKRAVQAGVLRLLPTVWDGLASLLTELCKRSRALSSPTYDGIRVCGQPSRPSGPSERVPTSASLSQAWDHLPTQRLLLPTRRAPPSGAPLHLANASCWGPLRGRPRLPASAIAGPGRALSASWAPASPCGGDSQVQCLGLACRSGRPFPPSGRGLSPIGAFPESWHSSAARRARGSLVIARVSPASGSTDSLQLFL